MYRPLRYLALKFRRSFYRNKDAEQTSSRAEMSPYVWRGCYVLSALLLLLLLGVLTPMALFRASLNLERRLGIKQAQLHLASALDQRLMSTKERCSTDKPGVDELGVGACDDRRVTTPGQARRLYRAPDRRLLTGVAGGIAEHLNIPAWVVRICFVALLAFNGLGAVLYVVFWAVLPMGPDHQRSRRDVRQLLPFLAIGGGVLLLLALTKQGWESTLGWLVAVVALGAGLIWQQADPARRQRWSEKTAFRS